MEGTLKRINSIRQRHVEKIECLKISHLCYQIFFSSSGVEYDFFGIGEFWGCKSRKNDFGLQFRFFYYERASLIGGLAVKTGQSIVTVMTIKTQYPEDSPNVRQVIPPHVRAGIQDSLGFWIPRRGYPDSRYQIPAFISETCILIASEIPDSFSCIPDSKAQDSGFYQQIFPGFLIPLAKNLPDSGIRILPMSSRLSLHRSINMDNSSIVGSEFTF